MHVVLLLGRMGVILKNEYGVGKLKPDTIKSTAPAHR
jgi:hypothetical protein